MKSDKRRRIRYAVVGLGHLSQVAVLPGFKSARNSELAALVSGEEGKRLELGKKYDVPTYSYDQFEECISQGIDAVYIVLPNHLHREYTIRALNAGAHVLCEKPMAVSEEDCEAMIAAAATTNRKLMIAYRLHFEKGNLQAIEWAKQGEIGDPRYFTSEFSQQVVADNIRVTEDIAHGGGPVYDMGVYCINAARYLFRDEPIHVLASTANSDVKRFAKTEEMASVILRFPKERLATFTASFGAADVSRYRLVGTEGSICAEPAFDYSMGIKLQLTKGEKTVKQSFPKRDQFAAELVYFSDCIVRDVEPEPSGTEGLADVRIVRAIYESARRGEGIELPRFSVSQRPDMNQEIHRPAHGNPKTTRVESPSGEAA